MLHFNFKMSDQQTEQEFSGTRVALGITGGIAAYKAIEVLRGLQRAGCEVRVTMTKHACEFVQPLTFRALSGSSKNFGNARRRAQFYPAGSILYKRMCAVRSICARPAQGMQQILHSLTLPCRLCNTKQRWLLSHWGAAGR